MAYALRSAAKSAAQEKFYRPLPLPKVSPLLAEAESHLDYSFFEQNCL